MRYIVLVHFSKLTRLTFDLSALDCIASHTMHFRVGFLALLASLVPNALAGIQITSPTNSDRFKGGDTVLIEWKNDGKAPFLKDIGSFNIDLCIGSNDEIVS